MILVADASFAAKVLLDEEGSTLAREVWDESDVAWVAPAIIGPEVEAALQGQHRRYPGDFPEAARRTAYSTWQTMLRQMSLHALDRALALLAMDMVHDHGPLRGADACYLAVGVELAATAPDDVVLGTFDHQQHRAATSAGVACLTG